MPNKPDKSEIARMLASAHRKVEPGISRIFRVISDRESLISEHWRRIEFEKRPDMTQIRELCREIDLLHPQVDDDGRRPDDVEYPWPGSSGATEIPAQWPFPLAKRLHSNPGRLLLKAAGSLTRNPAVFIR